MPNPIAVSDSAPKPAFKAFTRFLPRELPTLLLIALLCGWMGAFVPSFRGGSNLSIVGQEAAYIGIMACGEGLVIFWAAGWICRSGRLSRCQAASPPCAWRRGGHGRFAWCADWARARWREV